jgi:hypothetical protein
MLWLLLVPGLLLLMWSRQLWLRRRDVHAYRERHRAPGRLSVPAFGALPFWLCQIAALALVILALSEPRALIRMVRTAGVDVIILQDGSASMYVRDVKPDRWQRSVGFLRVLAESMQWRHDRIALALFAHIAAPQVRLTRDPNTFFFFLDHLQRESPFPLGDDTTWDTNIELGIHWGVRLVEKDQELAGPSPNGKVFVLMTDGQAWSGEMARALEEARRAEIPVHVVGVGTSYGGYIPQAPLEAAGDRAPVQYSSSGAFSVLDRPSLQTVASEGGGRYFEIGQDSDREVASGIIEAARRRAGTRAVEESFDELHWYCLAAAGWLVALSVLWVYERAQLILLTTGLGAAVAAATALMQ